MQADEAFVRTLASVSEAASSSVHACWIGSAAAPFSCASQPEYSLTRFAAAARSRTELTAMTPASSMPVVELSELSSAASLRM